MLAFTSRRGNGVMKVARLLFGKKRVFCIGYEQHGTFYFFCKCKRRAFCVFALKVFCFANDPVYILLHGLAAIFRKSGKVAYNICRGNPRHAVVTFSSGSESSNRALAPTNKKNFTFTPKIRLPANFNKLYRIFIIFTAEVFLPLAAAASTGVEPYHRYAICSKFARKHFVLGFHSREIDQKRIIIFLVIIRHRNFRANFQAIGNKSHFKAFRAP